LGAAVVVVALAVGVALFMLASPDKDSAPAPANNPPQTAQSPVSSSAADPSQISSQAQTSEGQASTGATLTAQAADVSSSASASSASSEASSDAAGPQTAALTPPPASDAQLATSTEAAATPATRPVRTQTQVAPRSKRLTKKQQQRKEEEARLIEQHAAELRAAQLQAQEARIQELLTAAKNEYAAGALWQPTGASAADQYREILKMQPARAEAVAGALRVANVLATEAANSEAAGDIYTSKLLVDQIQSLQPDYPKLGELQDRLQQLLANPASLSSHDRNRFERAAKYIARAQDDLGHKPLDFHAVDDATEQYDKAASAAPMAPGLPSLKERLIAAYPVAVRTELGNNDSKRALKLIGIAHKRNWSSEDLDQLEASIQAGGAPTAAIKEAGAR
jgi:hypothetical protein